MLSKDTSKEALRGLFRRCPVAHLEALFTALDTRSRMSVFRRLRDLGYFSSYTHRGGYYTLADIPEFDEHGLWRYEAIGFSRLGTLKATVAFHVHESVAGYTQAELQALLGLQVHNTLLGLVRPGTIRREVVAGTYLYLSSDAERANRQLEACRQQAAEVSAQPGLPSDEIVLLVLVEALHAAEGLPTSSVVAARLATRGAEVAPEQVACVFDRFGLEPGKKTAEPP